MKLSDKSSLASGIPLPTDSGLRAGMRKRFQKKAKVEEEGPTIEVGDAESNVTTEPKLAPPPNPTLTLDMSDLEYVNTPSAPMVAPDNKPEPRAPLTGARREESVLFQIPKNGEEPRESSVLVSLDALRSLGEARAEEEATEPARPAEPRGEPRESSVLLSLGELQHIETERVANEAAEGCSASLARLGKKFSDLAGQHQRVTRSYFESGVEFDDVLQEAFESIAPKFTELTERLNAAKAKIPLRAGEEGYLTLDGLKSEFGAISGEIDETVATVDACQSLLKQVREALAGKKRAAAEKKEQALAEATDDLLVSLDEPAEAAEPAPEPAEDKKPERKSWLGNAFARLASRFRRSESFRPEAAEAGAETGQAETGDEGPEISEGESVEVEVPKADGVPWTDNYERFQLSENELTICEGVMESRKVYWMLPVPSAEEAGADKIINKFKDDAVVRLGGQKYFVFSGDGFAGAKMVARVGRDLHVWPEAKTDYEYLGSMSIDIKDKRKEPVDWPPNFISHLMSLEECAECSYFLPENKPRWLHPVPEPDTKNDFDRGVLDSFMGSQQITLAGRKFYVLNVSAVSDWREMILYLPKTRIATRHNNWLSVWKEEDNGKFMFFNSGSFSSSYYGPRHPKGLRETREARPHDSEKLEVELIFDKMGQVWLYELDELPNMNANELGWIVKSANSTVQKHGISPLMSLEGRWYVALDIFVPDSMKVGFDGSLVRLLTDKTDTKGRLADMRARLAAKSGKDKFSLPPQPAVRQASITALPEGVVKYLLDVGDFEGELYRPWVSMTIEGRKNRLIILDTKHEGSFAVVRRGNQVFFAETGPDEDDLSVEIVLD